MSRGLPTTRADRETNLGDKPESAPIPVVPLRHYVRWLIAAAIGCVGAATGYALATSDNVDWDVVWQYSFNHAVLKGVQVTIELSVISMVLGMVLGVLLAVLRLSENPVMRASAALYIWFFRGTPLLVQLIFWFNLGILFPHLGFTLPFVSWPNAVDTNALISASTAAVLGLGLNEAAYYAEIVRAGILSVHDGQVMAAKSLGLTFDQTMRKIVLPQAMRVIIPPTGNEFITMLKTSALVTVIGGNELLNTVGSIYARNFEVIELLIVATLWYLVLTSVTSVCQYFLERHYSRGFAVTPGARGVSTVLSRVMPSRRAVVADV